MASEALAEMWAIGGLEDLSGTQVKWRLAPVRAPGHAYDLSAFATALDDEQEQTAFRAALGTVAPTYWISPSTYEVALEHFAPLRRDPEFVDPDVVEIIEQGDRRVIIEFKWRTWAEEATRGMAETMLGASTRSGRAWRRLDEGLIAAGQPGIVGYISGKLPNAVTAASSDEDVGHAGVIEEAEAALELPPSALVAREVRDLSGLTARQLGDVFPVARENFQRWISGDITPSDDNFERLLSLRHFFRALADRVDDPKVWLLSPLEDSAGEPSAYSLLVHGNLAALWDAVAVLPSRAPTGEFVDSNGDRGVRITTSLRGVEAAMPESELDEYAEWFDEE